ncbi:DUF4240 domain-containing protein [Hymenobacter chitinivorans]|uniref:DUF4240 domain-containing protein n=1 Tax=Hymenobacter chitinivorans TaxID=89969 RepID=UPI0012FE3BCC|nr:DUF4240 domain-containing protein [Hymenobacter chitinivorans]
MGALLFIGYRVIDYKFIQYQEREYEALAHTTFTESPRVFPDSLRMQESTFWTLIATSKAAHPQDLAQQAAYLQDTLAQLSDQDILGFECRLREQLIREWNYNIKSLYQITNGSYVSTDDFIYFRAYLISCGADVVQAALQNPEQLTIPLDRLDASGEEMLQVAKNAYAQKHHTTGGPDPHSPGEQPLAVDYDLGNYRMTGTYIAPADFDRYYPHLTARY